MNLTTPEIIGFIVFAIITVVVALLVQRTDETISRGDKRDAD